MIVSPVRSRRSPIDSSNARPACRASSRASSAKLVGQVELADDRQRIDARLAARPEHLGDHALAVVQRRREADHLDDHLVVRPGVLRAGIADVDRLGEQRAVDLHVGRALPTRNTCRRTGGSAARRLRRLDRGGPVEHGVVVASPLDVLDLDGHHVAAGRVERILGRDENVVGLRVVFRLVAAFLAGRWQRADEAKAFLRAMEHAHDPRACVFGSLALSRRFSECSPLSFRERGKG